MNPTAKTLIYISAAVLGISLLQFLMGIRPPRSTSNLTPSDLGMDYQEVSFKTSDSKNLKGWFIESEKETKNVVIIGHGYPFDKGNMLPIAELLQEDFNVFLYDFRYFGESEGGITTLGYKESQDVGKAIEYLKDNQEIDKIGLMGFSLSATSFLMSDLSKVDALVADSPYSDLEILLEDVYSIFPGPTKTPFVLTTSILSKVFLGFWPKDVSAEKNLENSTTPILFIHGEKDIQIPLKHSKILNKTADRNSELWIVEGAGHGQAFASEPEIYREKVTDFFQTYLD